MSKQDVLNDVSKFQRACDSYVRREVLYCVSTLISNLGQFAEHFDDSDDNEAYNNLVGGRADYEEAALNFVMNDADLSDMEDIAEKFGDWDDLVEGVRGTFPNLLKPYAVTYQDKARVEGDEDTYYCWALDEDRAITNCQLALPGCAVQRADDYDALDNLDDWCEHNPGLEQALREAVLRLMDEHGDAHQEVCNDHDLDVEYSEAYEFWLVSSYFADQLHQHGEVVEEFMGLKIWARGTTGQSISMDGVTELIVKSLGEHHWVWSED
jgi:hypothetical protein